MWQAAFAHQGVRNRHLQRFSEQPQLFRGAG